MGKPTGFLEYKRETAKVEAPKDRIKHFNEFRTPLKKEEQQKQGARCMECGVPFCQAGTMIAGMASGCPLHNLVPELNDLVYHGNWEQAYTRLTKTHCFPEFTYKSALPFVRQPAPVIWIPNRFPQRKMNVPLLKLLMQTGG